MRKNLLFISCVLFSFNLSSQEKNLSEGPFEQLIIRGVTLINGNGSPPLGPVDIVIEKNIIKSIKTVGYPGVEIRDEDGLVEEANNQIQLLLNVIYGFLSISIFVALFGITNTLSLSVFERTREIGLMRAIGTYRKQIRRMIFIESSIISIFGAALGTSLGIFFAWSLIQTLADEGFTVFAVSVPQTALWIGISIIAGVIAAILPAIRASRQNILQAISYE